MISAYACIDGLIVPARVIGCISDDRLEVWRARSAEVLTCSAAHLPRKRRVCALCGGFSGIRLVRLCVSCESRKRAMETALFDAENFLRAYEAAYMTVPLPAFDLPDGWWSDWFDLRIGELQRISLPKKSKAYGGVSDFKVSDVCAVL